MDEYNIRETVLIQKQEDCPHEMLGLDMKPTTALEWQKDGTYRCRFCGKVFSNPEDAKNATPYV